MTLNADEIAGMRTTVTAAMPDACTIKRHTADGTLNETTGLYSASTVTTLYTGACRVRPENAADRSVEIGDSNEILARYVATVPYDTASIDVNDFLTVTTSPFDGALVGEEFRIVEVQLGSWTLGRRLTLEKRQPIL